ncbi:MAG TPA: C-terminal binding protein [Pirellulales bacterium]|jgi:D-3-phosphoglycerate dehydrogenase/C-terminal binding protein|nr:C-terminal binding protein [Pirellulales bacterium]
MGARYSVVIADFIAGPLEAERRILGEVADVVALDASCEDDLVGKIESADAIMMYHTVSITPKTIDRLAHCKLIVRCGVGYDNVDWRHARKRGIDVANVPDYGTEEVADSAIGMALALARGITFFNSRLRDRQGEWLYTGGAPIWRLRGRVFGIVGLGRIGTAVAVRAKSLGMDVVFYDPYRPDGWDKAIGIRRVESLEALLAEAHVVSLHCPLSAETQHLMNAATIGKMRPGSFLINTARGGVLDVAAIPDAIASGQLAGAAIDVLEEEPPPEDYPLLVAWRNPEHPAYHRLVINPHSAFYCEEGLLDMRRKGTEACRRALVGEKPRNIVN